MTTQWLATDQGITHKPTGIFIDTQQLFYDIEGLPYWILHIARFGGIDLDGFIKAFVAVMHDNPDSPFSQEQLQGGIYDALTVHYFLPCVISDIFVPLNDNTQLH